MAFMPGTRAAGGRPPIPSMRCRWRPTCWHVTFRPSDPISAGADITYLWTDESWLYLIAEEDQAVVGGSSLSTNFWKAVSKPSS